MNTATRPDIRDIRAELDKRVLEVACALAPDGERIDGHRRWSLNPTRADRHANSFCIDISGPTRGRFCEFADGPQCSGDILNFIAYCVTGGGPGFKSKSALREAVVWATDFLGLEGADTGAVKRFSDRAAKARAERAAKGEAPDAAKERAARIKKAREGWFALPEVWRGTPVETYLSAPRPGRGLPVKDLDWPLGAVRFEADAFYKGGEGEPDGRHPAMACAMARGKRITAVHMTWLAPSGLGKADVGQAKKIRGDYRGAAIRLLKGRTGLSPEEMRRQGREREDDLAIGEGVENCLTWGAMHPDMRVWAAGTVGNIAAQIIPPCARRIFIIADNDPLRDAQGKPHPARVALERAAETLRAAPGGREVLIVRPEPGFKDFNDMWRDG
jgi:hypothetical protein